jgi:multidrug resistance efflux pump
MEEDINIDNANSNSSPSADGRLGEAAGKEIELRSEEVQEVLGSVPSWILRRGITLLALIVVVLLVGSWLFKYPEIISAPLFLTTVTPPAGIVARTSGKIALLEVKDQQQIKSGDCLAIIENPASYIDILFLAQELTQAKTKVNTEKTFILSRKDLKVGGIQSTYSSFMLKLDNYNKFIEINYYPQKIQSVKKIIEANRRHYQSMLKQKEIVSKQHELELRSFDREAYLKKQNMISEEENDKVKGQLLQSDMNVQNMHSSLENMQIQITQIEENLLDIKQQYLEKRNGLLSELKTNIDQLENEIRSWQMTYVLSSPITGKVTFTNYWAVNQNVVAGDVVFTVIPKIQTEMIGKAQLPIERSGKVRNGQSVNIHFNSFPDNEYGMVVGKINRISLIPTKDGKYIVEVRFPKGLTTSYGKKLPLSQEMTGNADIITDDIRLIEQFFRPLKKIFKNNL